MNGAFGEMRFTQVATSIRVPRLYRQEPNPMVHARSPGTPFIYSSIATYGVSLNGLTSYDKTMTIFCSPGVRISFCSDSRTKSIRIRNHIALIYVGSRGRAWLTGHPTSNSSGLRT